MITPEFCRDLWHHKTRVTGLLCSTVCGILSLAVLVELRLVKDRQTDRYTKTAYTVLSRELWSKTYHKCKKQFFARLDSSHKTAWKYTDTSLVEVQFISSQLYHSHETITQHYYYSAVITCRVHSFLQKIFLPNSQVSLQNSVAYRKQIINIPWLTIHEKTELSPIQTC